MTRERKSLTVLCCLVGMALVCLMAAGTVHAQKPIKIGLIDAFSGAAAAITKPSLIGWQMVIDEFNGKGGLDGRKMELVVRDDKFKPDEALSHARELVLKEGCQFLAGTTSSPSCLAVSEFAKTKKMIFMVHIARSHRITGEKGHKYVFAGCPNAAIEGLAGGEYAAKKPHKKWYIIGEDYEYGHSIADNFWKGLKKNKPEVEKVGDAWPKMGETDYTPYLTALVAKNPEAVYVAFGASGLIPFVKQAKLFGLFEKVPVFAFGLGDSLFPKALQQNMPTGVFVGNNYLWYFPDTPANKAFVEKYTEYTKKEGKADPYPSGLGGFGGWCSAKFLTDAILKAKSIEADKVIAALEGLTIETAIGPIQMRACDHQAATPAFWGEVANVPGAPFPIMKDVVMTPPDKVMPSCEEVASARKGTKD